MEEEKSTNDNFERNEEDPPATFKSQNLMASQIVDRALGGIFGAIMTLTYMKDPIHQDAIIRHMMKFSKMIYGHHLQDVSKILHGDSFPILYNLSQYDMLNLSSDDVEYIISEIPRGAGAFRCENLSCKWINPSGKIELAETIEPIDTIETIETIEPIGTIEHVEKYIREKVAHVKNKVSNSFYNNLLEGMIHSPDYSDDSILNVIVQSIKISRNKLFTRLGWDMKNNRMNEHIININDDFMGASGYINKSFSSSVEAGFTRDIGSVLISDDFKEISCAIYVTRILSVARDSGKSPSFERVIGKIIDELGEGITPKKCELLLITGELLGVYIGYKGLSNDKRSNISAVLNHIFGANPSP